jgi:hypothetical protein
MRISREQIGLPGSSPPTRRIPTALQLSLLRCSFREECTPRLVILDRMKWLTPLDVVAYAAPQSDPRSTPQESSRHSGPSGPFPSPGGWRTKAALTHSTPMVRGCRGRCQGRRRAAPVAPWTWVFSGDGAGRRGWPRSAATDREAWFRSWSSVGGGSGGHGGGTAWRPGTSG